MARVVGRKADERILDWIRRRKKGDTAAAIAADAGVNPSQVLQSTNDVLKHDIAESDGEDVRRRYWA